jgi:ribosomal protein S18 acetylase RimI-like enzyme
VTQIKLVMHRSSLDDLPALAPVPQGHELAVAGHQDAEKIARLLTAAFDQKWSPQTVHRVLLDAPDVDQTWIIAHRMDLVATASAQLPVGNPRRSGRLHWVATDPSHRRRRLGYTVSLRALHRLRELGCTEAQLLTDPPRTHAIRLYLGLGFVPQPLDAEHEAAWEELLAAMSDETHRA